MSLTLEMLDGIDTIWMAVVPENGVFTNFDAMGSLRHEVSQNRTFEELVISVAERGLARDYSSRVSFRCLD
jgi:hypothetical protein